MKTATRSRGENGNTADEVLGLGRALDKSYARLRERAQREWSRNYSGPEPSDACVRVRIARNERRSLAL